MSSFPGFPGGAVVKNLPAKAGDMGSISGLGRSPGEGNGKPTPVFLPGKTHGQRGPGGLQSMGLQRVRHDWAQNAFMSFISGSYY